MDPIFSSLQNLWGSDVYAWVILPIFIFLARVLDVSLGTIRIIFISRGRRSIAPLLGFIEVFIWVVAIGQIVQHLHSITSFLAYAAGFAAGNFVGMYLEDKLAFGTVIVRVIVPSGGEELFKPLHEAGYGVTRVDGLGAAGPVQLIYTIVKRKQLAAVMEIIHEMHPNAFLSIEDVRSTQAGIFPAATYQPQGALFGRKSK